MKPTLASETQSYGKFFDFVIDFLIRVNLFLKFDQSWRSNRYSFISSRLYLLSCQHMPIEEKLPQKFLTVVHPQIGVL